MKLSKIILFVSFQLLLIVLISCKKEEVNWAWCNNCSASLIVGEYEGKGDHYRYVDTINYVKTPDQNTYMNISLDGSTTVIQAGIINLYGVSLSGVYNNTYYIEMGSSGEKISATIWRSSEDKIKIIGTSKKLDSNGNTTQLIDFEVHKKETP